MFQGKNKNKQTQITLKIKTTDKIGILQKISSIITSMGVNIKSTTARPCLTDKRRFICKYNLNVKNFDSFMKIIEHLDEIEKESKWIRKISE